LDIGGAKKRGLPAGAGPNAIKLSDKADVKGLMPGVLCETVCERDLADKPPWMGTRRVSQEPPVAGPPLP